MEIGGFLLSHQPFEIDKTVIVFPANLFQLKKKKKKNLPETRRKKKEEKKENGGKRNMASLRYENYIYIRIRYV